VRIHGDPGPDVAAAIAAVVALVEEEEARLRATPRRSPRQSAWVESWRPRDIEPPLPSHVYDAQPWALLEPSGTEDLTADGEG